MATQNITGNISDVVGTAQAGAVLTIRPVLGAWSNGSALVFGEEFTVTADGTGAVDFDVEPGAYSITISLSYNSRYQVGMVVGSSGPYGLAEVVNATQSQTLTTILADAVAARALSQAYAQTPEDTTVPGGTGYSALHYAAKAETLAGQLGELATVQATADQIAADRGLAETAAANAQASARTCATWTALLALTGTADGEGAEVLDTDTGTHLAASGTGYDGASVSNAGRYSWSAAWSRWVRIGSTGLAAKASIVNTVMTGSATAENLAVSGTLTKGGLAVATEAFVRAAPSNNVHDLPAIAAGLGAAYIRIHPSLCFAERSFAGTTPCAVGDLVGSIRSLDGSWVMIATSDAYRGTLGLDANGNYYLNTTGAGYFVHNSSGVPFEVGDDWTMIAGLLWASGNYYPFCWSSANNYVMSLWSSTSVGNRSTVRNASNVDTRVFLGVDAPPTVPGVYRLTRSATDIAAYYNDSPARGAAAFAPLAKGANDGKVGYFIGRYVVAGGSWGGRFYGTFLHNGTLTADQTRKATEELMSLTLPATDTKATGETYLDFTGGSYRIRGQAATSEILTDNGGGSYTLNSLPDWAQSRTIILDVEPDLGAGSWSGDLLNFTSGNGVAERIVATNSYRLSYYGAWQHLVAPNEYADVDTARQSRHRVAFVIEPGKKVKSYSANGLQALSNYMSFPSTRPTSLTINTTSTGITVHRVAIYPRALSGEDLRTAFRMGDTFALHLAGDSFVAANMAAALATQIEANVTARFILSDDGVGGAAFFESTGVGHSQRYARNIDWLTNRTLLLMDGGFEYGRGSGQYLPAIQGMVERLAAGETFIFNETNPLNPVGDSRFTEWQDAMTAVKGLVSTSVYPDPAYINRYVETFEAMLAANDGSPTDVANVALGKWPASLTGDGTHPTTAGQAVYGRAMFGVLADIGVITYTTTTPGAVQNLIATGSVLTWDAPASDGGHPVMGYVVERNTGSWVAQTAQGSPSGYTKQYVRSWTAPAAGTYRVAAITRKGTGTYTEVVVS